MTGEECFLKMRSTAHYLGRGSLAEMYNYTEKHKRIHSKLETATVVTEVKPPKPGGGCSNYKTV